MTQSREATASPAAHLRPRSGSCTDSNEDGEGRVYATGGEVPLTTNIWPLDPAPERAGTDDITIFAGGLRNPFDFDWNTTG